MDVGAYFSSQRCTRGYGSNAGVNTLNNQVTEGTLGVFDEAKMVRVGFLSDSSAFVFHFPFYNKIMGSMVFYSNAGS